MTQPQNDIHDETPLRVRRGRVESVDLYEIKDSELDMLEKGSPSDLQLNFSIALLSAAFTSLTSLLTSTFPNPTTKIIFILFTIVGFIFGIYLLISWYRNHTSLKEICKKIRERIPPDVSVQETNENTQIEASQPEPPKD